MKNMLAELSASWLVEEEISHSEEPTSESGDELSAWEDLNYGINRYMREVNAIPRLSHEEIVELFRLLRETQWWLKGMTSEAAGQRQTLEERVLHLKQQLINANLRLVVYFANKYDGLGISLQDLVQEGNIGLMRAIDKFDYRLGYRFSTYAAWWIRQAMLKTVHQQAHIIRIPVHKLEQLRQHRRASQDNGTESAQSLDDDGAWEVMQLQEILQEPLPLDEPLADRGLSLQQVIGSEDNAAPEEETIDHDLKRKLPKVLSTLSSREEIILRLRYGVGIPSSYTLEEVGKIFNLTKERIRQIETAAIQRLNQQYCIH
jgi:RNA polymerase primary sigma factor